MDAPPMLVESRIDRGFEFLLMAVWLGLFLYAVRLPASVDPDASPPRLFALLPGAMLLQSMAALLHPRFRAFKWSLALISSAGLIAFMVLALWLR